ncbi:hypothetical protein LPJ61_002457 [Coemansia biformis]|uniref:Zn(2)-C6 fungal-type domain-containing protein n=1 Tax=Coemansia biformis TaxID=1286918 RepID=A0A9W8CX73_9FUNG|nr:hypothetical protein LPJ61_002457 [Coemansia biformis]
MVQNAAASDPQHQQQQQQGAAPAGTDAAADAATEKKDDKAAPVRKRLSLACTTCRQRKVKCDGARPSCRTCAKFNWPCIYQPSNRKRGPRPRALALMEGGAPYSTRPHWSAAHGYYAYGIPGHPPMSPPMQMPPPPPLHQMMPSMPDHRYMDIPQNGAPIHADPAHGGIGSYNNDLYSTYGDYIASTGGIRIRPPGPPPPPPHMAMAPHQSAPHLRQPMHGPPFNPMSPPSAHMHGGGPSRHRADSYGRAGGPQPPLHPYHHPFHHAPHRMSAAAAPDALHPMPPAPPPPPPFSHPPGSTTAEPSGNSAAHARYHAPHASPMRGMPGHMHVAPTGASVSPAIPQPRSGMAAMGKAPAHQPAAMSLSGSTAPQLMHPSAQSYTSASAYAQDVQPASTDASTHAPAIYADPGMDIVSSRSTSITASTTASSPGAGSAAEDGAFGQHVLHTPGPDNLALSSPVQPSRGGCPTAAELSMTAPIPSSSAFSGQQQQQQHRPHRPQLLASEEAGRGGAADPAPYGLAAAADRAKPSRASPRPLPFSDGVSRPQLPPLSEVFGKDYQLLLSPGGRAAGPAVDPAHFDLAARRRTDPFPGEVPRIHAQDSMR